METEGQRDVEGLGVELPFIGQPIKIKKVNIRIDEAPKLANDKITGTLLPLTKS
jgi:hypothetical protein